MTQAAILAASGSPGTTTGFKNRIINGNMTIDQRNNGAQTNSATNNGYTLDRWATQNNSGASRFTVQRNANSITPPAGFINYLGCVSTGAYSPASGDAIGMIQRIEGYNIADLGWGSANAKTVTLSFWVYSSLTGSFGGCFFNGNGNYSYPFTYTISTANTWQQITLTVAGPTSGSWSTDNSTGINVIFALGTGSALSGPANSWSANGYYGATGQVNWVGTNAATFYITGVQLEVGTTATNFDFRSYGTELSLCQRYLPAISTSGAVGSPSFICNGYNASSASWYGIYPFKVTPRTPPTGITTVNPTSSFNVQAYGATFAISAIAYLGGTSDAGTFYATCSGLNVGQGSVLNALNGNGQILFNGCEL